jgi:TorA maturation chaperone TorD
MPDPTSLPDTQAVDLARECLYRFLAAAVRDPGGEAWAVINDQESGHLAVAAADCLREDGCCAGQPRALGELPVEHLDLRGLLEEWSRRGEGRREEYDRVFGLVPARECPPYETEYHPAKETFFRSQQMADVAGFYRAFGLQPGAASPERPDHLGLELEFMAIVLMKKRLAAAGGSGTLVAEAEVCDQAERAFFREHLAWWVPAFARGMRRKAGGGPYAALGELLAAFVFAERCRLGVPAPRHPVEAALIERPDEQPGCATCPAIG